MWDAPEKEGERARARHATEPPNTPPRDVAARVALLEQRLESIDAKLDEIVVALRAQARPLSVMERHVHSVERMMSPFLRLR